MSDEFDLTYYYDPTPEPPPKPAGVEVGWMVLWDGEPGPALIAKTGLLYDEDGGVDVVPMEDFKGCNVIDDSAED